MPTTRAKAAEAKGNDAPAGSKHELEGKQEGKSAKKQKTLKETVQNGEDNKSGKKGDGGKVTKTEQEASESRVKSEEAAEDGTQAKNADSEAEEKEQNGKTDDVKDESKNNSLECPSASGPDASSSSMLETGIIYFFLRGRVNTEDPSSINEIQRTYLILRPSSKSSTTSALPNRTSRSRLLAVPKKSFPTTGRERWISFVEKTDASFADLRDNFLTGNEYETKTRGTQQTPAAKPEGEGVYAIVRNGRQSHLVYILTRPKPEEMGEVQKKLGIKERGSWVVTTRNPEFPPPGGVGRLPAGPEFPKDIIEDFRSLRWAPTEPRHLDVAGAQILLVGESSGIEKATDLPQSQAKEGEDPKEELEDLADEDEKRMEKLSADDTEAIFKDLQASAKDLPDMQMEF